MCNVIISWSMCFANMSQFYAKLRWRRAPRSLLKDIFCRNCISFCMSFFPLWFPLGLAIRINKVCAWCESAHSCLVSGSNARIFDARNVYILFCRCCFFTRRFAFVGHQLRNSHANFASSTFSFCHFNSVWRVWPSFLSFQIILIFHLTRVCVTVCRMPFSVRYPIGFSSRLAVEFCVVASSNWTAAFDCIMHTKWWWWWRWCTSQHTLDEWNSPFHNFIFRNLEWWNICGSFPGSIIREACIALAITVVCSNAPCHNMKPYILLMKRFTSLLPYC